MTNAFEKHLHPHAPIWVHSFSLDDAENRTAAVNVISSSDFGNAGVILDDLTPAPGPGMVNPVVGGLSKRFMDLVIATTALALAAPVMILVALLIRMTMGGPTVFSHTRVGRGGKPFRCYKFRSMVCNADEVLKACIETNPEIRLEWEKTHKIRNDPRVTRLGRMLRKSSLDELPQLFNVIRGDMSCVGPRPVVKDELPQYGDHLGEYLQGRPGLTGLWQVSGRSSVDYASRVALDSQYVRNWSIWLDVSILFKTVFAVMRFDRAS
jgi:exopolysaccharide production protein ExoY